MRKRNGPKRKSVVPAQKLVIFEKLKAVGGFRDEDPAELREAEQMLRTFAATDKVGVEPRFPPIARR